MIDIAVKATPNSQGDNIYGTIRGLPNVALAQLIADAINDASHIGDLAEVVFYYYGKDYARTNRPIVIPMSVVKAVLEHTSGKA